jgi:hypothetical protein
VLLVFKLTDTLWFDTRQHGPKIPALFDHRLRLEPLEQSRLWRRISSVNRPRIISQRFMLALESGETPADPDNVRF